MKGWFFERVMRLSALLLAATVGWTWVAYAAETRLPSSTPLASASPVTWNYVALGDSWPAGGHCGGCRTFVGLWADDLQTATGNHVSLTDLTGAHEPGLPSGEGGGTSTSLLASLRFNQTTRDAIRNADIVLVATGGNDLGLVFDVPPAGGDCQGKLQIECVRALGRVWSTNFSAILDEIRLLRAGAPTVIRLVDSANPVLSDPSLLPFLSDDLAPTKGALIFQELNDAMCAAATTDDAKCVDVRPIINGPSMDQPGAEESPATMQAIADALMATGIAEIEPGTTGDHR